MTTPRAVCVIERLQELLDVPGPWTETQGEPLELSPDFDSPFSTQYGVGGNCHFTPRL